MAKGDKIAVIDIKGVKVKSARRYVPKTAIVAHKYSFGTLYYYGADTYFVPKRGYKVVAGK